MASNKITANFGADVSEVEAGMVKATRATKAYERAVKGLGEVKKGGGDLTADLARSNEQLAKGMNLLRGGAVGAGVTMLLGKMQQFSNHAREMGDAATEAQKSAAKWGDELKAFSDTITGLGASALGTLASFGRSIGESFRDPADAAYDDVAKASEESADRQITAAKKMKEARDKALAEIPKLKEKLAGEHRETELANLDAYSRALTDQYELEKKIAELNAKPSNAVNEAAALELLIELEKKRRTVRAEADKIQKQESEAEQKALEQKGKTQQSIDEAAFDMVKEIGGWRKENDEAELARVEAIKQARLAAIEAEAKARRAAFGEGLEKEGYTTGDDGKLRRGNVIVSNEDAARTMATKARNAEFTAESERRGISRNISNNAPVSKRSGELLEKIESYLRPID